MKTIKFLVVFGLNKIFSTKLTYRIKTSKYNFITNLKKIQT